MDGMSITYKKMETEEETKGKAYVHWKSWQDAYAGIVDPGYLDKLTLDNCIETAYKWPDNLIVAKDGDRVVGFVGYGENRNDDLTDTGEIFALYILKEYYGQGVGYRLMQEGLSRINNYPEVAVWVLKDNERAIRFYERCGFKDDGCEDEIKLGTTVIMKRMILAVQK